MEYDKAARTIDVSLEKTWPSRSQYYRWLSGTLKNGIPHPDSCRVLEQMFPEWTAKKLFAVEFAEDSSTADSASSNNSNGRSKPNSSLLVNGDDLSDRSSDVNGRQVDVVVPWFLSTENTEGADVDRLNFIRSLLCAGIGTVASNSPGGWSIQSSDIERYKRDLAHLYELDDQHGGAAVYDLTLRTVRKFRYLSEHGSFDSETGRELHAVTGQVTEHAGWLAYDAGRHAEARHWWLEALHSAQMVDDQVTMVVALASMSLQAARTNRPREAVDLAQAAQRIAQTNTTPRLRALLLTREALGHAGNGSSHLAGRTFAQATSLLDKGPRDGDPAWVDFFDDADLSWHRMLADLDLQDTHGALLSGRIAFESVDENVYPRNFALYGARLAQILAEQDNTDEAIALASRAIVHAQMLGSARVMDEARGAVYVIARVDDSVRAAQFLDWSSHALSIQGKS